MRRLVGIACCAVLCGCVVVPDRYYLPVSESGELESVYCEMIGPPEIIVISEDDVSIRLYVHRFRYRVQNDYTLAVPAQFLPGEKYTGLGISISGSPGSRVVLGGDAVMLGVNGAEPRQYRFNAYYRTVGLRSHDPDYSDAAVDDPLDFVTRDQSTRVNYHAQIWLDTRKPESVHLAPFEIEINGRPVVIGPIDFVWKLGVFSYPLNC